ncbi:MAG: hypothetical protein IH875_10875 [Candidatus Dadabacteria bacterium]|nr:hypothetical protein [Candidatus Dadabacteria bacterium]
MTPRLSGKELAEKRKEKRMEEEEKLAKAEKLKTDKRLASIREQKEQLDLLETFHTPIYNEIDKLNKKASKEQLSDYTLNKINDHIEQVKSVLPDDPYISKINKFEPAGDNPEYRDVALALAEIGAGIKRFHNQLVIEENSLKRSNESESSEIDFDYMKLHL